MTNQGRAIHGAAEEDRDELPVVGEPPVDAVPQRALLSDRRLEIRDDAAVVMEPEAQIGREGTTTGGLDELNRPVRRVADPHFLLVLLAVPRDDERDASRDEEFETGGAPQVGDAPSTLSTSSA